AEPAGWGPRLTKGAADPRPPAWLEETAAALRIRIFIASSSSSSAAISFSSRIWRISFSSLRSNEPPWRPSGCAYGLREEKPLFAAPRGLVNHRGEGPRLLELLLQGDPGHAQGEAGAAQEGPGGQRGEQEVLLGD